MTAVANLLTLEKNVNISVENYGQQRCKMAFS